MMWEEKCGSCQPQSHCASALTEPCVPRHCRKVDRGSRARYSFDRYISDNGPYANELNALSTRGAIDGAMAPSSVTT